MFLCEFFISFKTKKVIYMEDFCLMRGGIGGGATFTVFSERGPGPFRREGAAVHGPWGCSLTGKPGGARAPAELPPAIIPPPKQRLDSAQADS